MDLSRTGRGRWIAAAWLCAALVPGAGCHLFEAVVEDEDEDAAAAADPNLFVEAVDTKLRHHSACRDIVASVMNESWERYSDQVDDDGKPKRRREGVFVRGVGTNNFRGCKRVIASHDSTAEMPIIEQATVALVDAANRYAALTRELERYIESKQWTKDNWAKLTELDAPLRLAHDQWISADAVLQRAIDLRHVENDQLLLGVLERRASRLEFASRRVMVYARPLVRCLEREPSPSAEDCRPLFDGFATVEGEFEDIHETTAGADKVFWMSTFANDVEEFHEIAGDLVRKLGQRKLRASDLQGVRDAYSSLVRDAETLDFDFP